jgi:predicted Zn finger-like uncharacterized protein
MIVDCINCEKKFDVESDLIPDKGRLVQCNSCDFKWFFKKEIIDVPIKVENDETINLLDKASDSELDKDNIIQNYDVETVEENILDKKSNLKTKYKRNYNILNLFIVFIISFVALIIVIDTFKYPIGKIVPNIELLLYNLYESLKDIILFVRDLI